MISVWTSPLFEVRKVDGSRERVGLQQLLANAHIYADLLARTPTGKCALIRLFIALLEDALRPETIDDRRALLEARRFDMETIKHYIDECERDGPRFLLDDPLHPFMQMAYDPKLDAKADKPIATLTFDVPSGNNHVHLDHRYEDELVLSAAEAFEAMMETYLFCPPGTAGPSNINNTPPIYFLLRGDNLFETLVLNMVAAGEGEELGYIPFGAGQVPWRMNVQIQPKASVDEMSYLRAMTWQPRRVTLHIEDDGMVRRCSLQPGLDFRGDGRWKDPHVAYIRNHDGKLVSLKPQTGRAIWRDVGHILKNVDEKGSQPTPLSNLEMLKDGNDAVIEATGMMTQNATCLGWFSEALCMPQAILSDPDSAESVRACINISEEIVRTIDFCAKKKLDLGSDGKKKPNEQLAEQACGLFLQMIHDELFEHTIEGVLSGGDEWRSHFAEAVRDAVRCVLRNVIDQCGTSVEMMKRQGEVRGMLMSCVNNQLKGW